MIGLQTHITKVYFNIKGAKSKVFYFIFIILMQKIDGKEWNYIAKPEDEVKAGDLVFVDFGWGGEWNFDDVIGTEGAV